MKNQPCEQLRHLQPKLNSLTTCISICAFIYLLPVNLDLSSTDDFPKPQIRVHPETTIALRGTNVTLTCKAVSSSDSPMSTTWRKDSEILYDADVENLVRYQKQDGEVLEYTTVLHVPNVNFTDEGKYQCIISNHFGSNYSSKAKLTVNGTQDYFFFPLQEKNY